MGLRPNSAKSFGLLAPSKVAPQGLGPLTHQDGPYSPHTQSERHCPSRALGDRDETTVSKNSFQDA